MAHYVCIAPHALLPCKIFVRGLAILHVYFDAEASAVEHTWMQRKC